MALIECYFQFNTRSEVKVYFQEEEFWVRAETPILCFQSYELKLGYLITTTYPEWMTQVKKPYEYYF